MFGSWLIQLYREEKHKRSAGLVLMLDMPVMQEIGMFSDVIYLSDLPNLWLYFVVLL